MPTKDPAKKKAQQLRWLEKNPGRMGELQKAWREKNKDRSNEMSRESRRRNLAVMIADPSDKRHGTYTGYVYGCRCTLCIQARSFRPPVKRKTKPLLPGDVRHGTTSAYTNHGCRCDLCKAAKSARMAKYRAARREVRDEVMGK